MHGAGARAGSCAGADSAAAGRQRRHRARRSPGSVDRLHLQPALPDAHARQRGRPGACHAGHRAGLQPAAHRAVPGRALLPADAARPGAQHRAAAGTRRRRRTGHQLEPHREIRAGASRRHARPAHARAAHSVAAGVLVGEDRDTAGSYLGEPASPRASHSASIAVAKAAALLRAPVYVSHVTVGRRSLVPAAGRPIRFAPRGREPCCARRSDAIRRPGSASKTNWRPDTPEDGEPMYRAAMTRRSATPETRADPALDARWTRRARPCRRRSSTMPSRG